MNDVQPPTLATGRYLIRQAIGAGAMGTVHRATDRLSGRDVALKRVEIAAAVGGDLDALEERRHSLVALAHEFRTLAALRHPHIISVLDYGFGADQQPYFTMELLEGAQPLLDAAAELPALQRTELLAGAVDALAYLHQRGILHHDIKPGNVLVAGGRARLLDFGLSVLADQRRDDDMFGTLLYLAPEVLDGRPYTAASDMYSIGVIAYELLAGRHPFAADTAREFIVQVQTRAPDLAPLSAWPALADLVARLLSKAPEGRPGAAAAAEELRAIHGQAAPDDAIRESYLQAAALVGRDAELAQLRGALERAIRGEGALWLVGGESGAGKSRLLDELRAEALVAGAIVAVGQAVEGGGQPYQAWREPLRRLALESPLSDLDVGVLEAIVPDLAELLGRRAPDAPALPGEAGRLRLHATIIDLLRRIQRPLLLILEDLHWAHESLQLLREAAERLADSPVLFIGSYRADEWRGERRAVEQHMLLDRLPAERVAELSAAIIGPAGRNAALVELLQRESEGNAFFVVEVVRALADAAGGLARIGERVPHSIFAGGLRSVLRRRLERVPAWCQPLLRRAAVAGRQIDLAVLHALAGADLDHNAWLRAGADAAVLEVDDERWRFAHDKLREALLEQLDDAERASLHREVALAIEAAHPAPRDRQARAEILLDHWRLAGAPDRAANYALMVVSWMCDYSAEYDQAARQLDAAERLGAALPAGELARLQLQIALRRGQIDVLRGQHEAARPHYARALQLAAAVGDRRAALLASAAIASADMWAGELAASEARITDNLAVMAELGDGALRADSMRMLGVLRQWQGRSAEASQLFHEALRAASGDQRLRALILGDLGQQIGDAGDIRGATAAFEEVLAISRATGDRAGEAFALMNIGFGYALLRDEEQAGAYFGATIALAEPLGLTKPLGYALRGLGAIAEARGDLQDALAIYRRCLAATRQHVHHTLENLTAITIVQARLGDPAARDTLGELLDALQEIAIPEFQIEGVAAAAAVRWQAGEPAHAAELLALVDANEVISADARRSTEWLRPLLEAALPEAEHTAARLRAAALDAVAALDAARDWLGVRQRS